MSTTEHLFMQIFSRKRSIEDQFKHQVESYGENLVSNLLSEGLRPPPWLWISRSLCPNPGELNREQLISEILDQHPRATTPAKSNIYNVQESNRTNVNLFSSFTFREQDVLSEFCGVTNRDECVSKDVPESSMQNSETRVEVGFAEKQFTNSSVSHNDTNNRCSKRAKTLDNLVEEHNSPEFTGRVTRSMSADKKSRCVNRNDSVRRSRSEGHNCQSLDSPSIMTESQGISNVVHDGSEVNKCILDGRTASTAEYGCQLTNTLSSRLSAISLLPGPDIHFAEIIECDECPVSKFDQENIKNEEILHNSRTISRIEESHVDSAKEQVDGFVEIANPLSSIQTSCKRFEKTPASDRNADKCHANSKEAISSTGITNKSESKPVVERKGLYLNGNPIADSDIFCNTFNQNGEENAYTSETDVQVIGSNANVSLPLTDHLHGTGYDSSSIINVLNSFKNFTVQPTLVQKVVMEGSDGEKYTGQAVNEVIEVHSQDKSTDTSDEKDTERSGSLSMLSRNDFRNPKSKSEEKITLKEFGLVEERMTPDAKKGCKSVQTRYLLRSSTSHDKQHSASTFSVTTNSCNLTESVDKGHNNTWPKQDKNKNRFINVLHTSPRLGVKTHKHNDSVDFTGKKSSDYISGAIIESQSTMASQNTEVELPEDVSGSQFGVKQINKKPQTWEGKQESIGKRHSSDEDQEVNVGKEYFGINADRNVPSFDKRSLGKVGDNSSLKLGEYKEQHGSSTLSGISKSCYLKESMDEGPDNTWPKRKRNRSQFNNVLGTSPRLRIEMHKHKKPVNSISKKSSANISGTIFEFQPAMTAQNTEVEIPEAVSGSHIRVEPVSKKPRNLEVEHESRGKYHASDEDQEVNIGEEYFSIITDCNVPNLDKRSLEMVIINNPSDLDKREESIIKSKAQGREGSLHNVDGSSMFSEYHEDIVVNLDEDLPDEEFAIDIAPIIADGMTTADSKISSLSEERASLLEQLCKSGRVLTMESCPLDDNIQKIPDVQQFSLADVLEQSNLSCDNWSDKDQPSTSKNVRTMEKFPSTPPIETLQQRKMRKSFASGEEHVSNPDYVCFRIDENSSVSQEETTSDHVINSNEVCRSPNITALADVTSKYQNIMPITDSVSRRHSERETFDSVKPKSRLKANSKENINLEGKLSHGTNRTGSLQRVSSAKTTNRNIVKSLSEKWSKPNNIVSNVSSFIPLVKEKQQTTTNALGKRDIKVKALEAAEATKRLEEKKQQEREMKKAAAKLERVRLEQENNRQLEVKQKQKEELRKKKGADIEAKKRQRVVEKAEKERKRRCTEETRRHQRANEKNMQDKNEDVNKRKRKEVSKGAKKLTKSDNGMKAACMASRDTTSVVSKAECDNLTHVISSVNAHGAPPQLKMITQAVDSCNLQIPIQDRMSVTAENRELSYEISPFKDSDDEDGDDYARRKKFVPSWARKESVNSNILANRHLDPNAVFSRKRSFDVLKVLGPPVNRRPLP